MRRQLGQPGNWYEIQVNWQGDWFNDSYCQYDSIEEARKRLTECKNDHPSYDFRIIRKTLVEDIIT